MDNAHGDRAHTDQTQADDTELAPLLRQLLKLIDELRSFVDAAHYRNFGLGAATDTAQTDAEPSHSKGLLHTLQVMLARLLSDPKSVAEHYARFAGLVLASVAQRIDAGADTR